MRSLRRNDKIEVTWVDPAAEDGGDPEKADLAVWQTLCHFVRIDRKRDIAVLIVRYSVDPEEGDAMNVQSGSLCIPIYSVKRIRKLRLTGDVSLSTLEGS